jgi:hypothetical protein
MDAVTNLAERVSRNGLVLVRLRVPKGTRSVPMSDPRSEPAGPGDRPGVAVAG